MKIFNKLLIVMIITLNLAGCQFWAESGKDIKNESTEVIDEQKANDVLGLDITAKNITEKGLTLIYKQSGGNIKGELQTGSPFVLEQKIDNEWVEVKSKVPEEERVWTAMAYLIKKNTSTEMEVNWEYLYGELPEGDYRIQKEVIDFRGAGDFDNYSCYAYFSI